MFAAIRGAGFPRSMASVSAAMFLGDAICQHIEQRSALMAASRNTNEGVSREPLKNGDGSGLTAPDDVIFPIHLNFVMGDDDTITPSQVCYWNASRSVRMGITGFFVSGVISQSTYLLAAKYLSHLSAARRVAIIVAVAPLNITATMGTPPLLCGHTYHQVSDKCRRDVPPTFALNTLFWPGALWFTITQVRLVNQASVGSVFWLGWSVVLSMFVNRG